MCDLCTSDPIERTKVRDSYLMFAQQLDALAERYRDLAQGVIKPHTEKASAVGLSARFVVRQLVEEWV